MRLARITFTLLLTFLTIYGCGGNLFSGFNSDKTSEGDSALSAGEYSKAVDAYEEELEKYDSLADAPADLLEKLASAHMGKSGLDIISLVKSASEGGSDGELGTVLNLTPDPTDENIAAMKRAVELLNAIDDKTPTQEFQLGLAQTTQGVLAIKQVVNATAAGEPVNITPETASIIINNLAAAASSLGAAGEEDENGIAEQVTKLNEEIASDPDKLNELVNEAIAADPDLASKQLAAASGG